MSCPAMHNMSHNIKSEMMQERSFDHSVQRTRQKVRSRRKRHKKKQRKKKGVSSMDKLSSEGTVTQRIERGWLPTAFKNTSVIAAGSVSTSQSFILESDMVAEDVDFQDLRDLESTL